MTSPVIVDRDFTYRTVEGQQLRADVYLPREESPRAALLYFHGGGWELGSRTDYEDSRQRVLAARGFLVASVEYRFSARARFPAQRDDARAAAEWLRGQAPGYGASSDRIGAWGASAGGHLAALLALGDGAHDLDPAVEAAVVWFAPLDLRAQSGGTALERELFPPSSVDRLLGRTFDPDDADHRAADPLSLVSSAASPILLMTGDRDRVIDGSASIRMHEALTRAQATSVLQVHGGAGHEDPALGGAAGIGAVAGFFEEHLTVV